MRTGTFQVITLASLIWAVPVLGFAAESHSDTSDWHYGGSIDLSYAVDFNFPENNLWRSKTTTPGVNEPALNMAVGYVRKDVSVQSRWGLEFGLQEGNDTEGLVPPSISGRDKPVDYARQWKHFSRANVSYLAPVGNGLTVTAGLFNSYIGYQSIYSRYNLNYTRSYMADNAPYFVFGLAATYPINEATQVGFYIINGYNYLSHINNQPSYGTQVVWKPTTRLTLTENLYYGPDQSNTALEFWRFFSDSIIEWKDGPFTFAAAYDVGTENAAELPGHPRTFWTAAALYAHWNVSGPWSVALRPECYWDRNARITGSEQFIAAVTTTLEYKWRVDPHTLLARLEHRYDDSRGTQGGFFTGDFIGPGTIGLTPGQHLVLFSLIWFIDH
ncbi:MAG: outer membrane beta-barrel protein [Nitrospira sp.]|nr:outer membrane beta-barrel protein [Nitrospira sp.]